MTRPRLLPLVLGTVLLGCASPDGLTIDDQRADVVAMRVRTLADLYTEQPEVRDFLQAAPGYAVFRGFSTQAGIVGTNNAYGIARDASTGMDTYMKGFGLGAGLGLGVKEARIVLVFENEDALHKFVNDGWVFGAVGDAAAKTSSSGGSVGSGTALDDGVVGFVLTEAGLLAGVSLRGSKVWIDEELN